jgi:TorA maturation chaperone TorD
MPVNAPVTDQIITLAHSQPGRQEGLQEEAARANFYALLARLFYAGPDAELLAAIAGADELAAEGRNVALAEAWNALAAASAATDAHAAQREYDAVFVGTGKAPVTPYATYYLVETGREKLLAGLRGELDAMGLARAEGAHEPEDHFAGLCDVMRLLIAAGADEEALVEQSRFFDRYLRRSYPALCEAVEACDAADFYRSVARFAKAFLDVEVESFEML